LEHTIKNNSYRVNILGTPYISIRNKVAKAQAKLNNKIECAKKETNENGKTLKLIELYKWSEFNKFEGLE
jgi:hypothetical protein